MGGREDLLFSNAIPPPATASGDTSRKWTLLSLTFWSTLSLWAVVMLVWRHAPFTPGGRPVTFVAKIKNKMLHEIFCTCIFLESQYINIPLIFGLDYKSCFRKGKSIADWLFMTKWWYLILHQWNKRWYHQGDSLWPLSIQVGWQLITKGFTSSCGQHYQSR